jgi:hypothetical protein
MSWTSTPASFNTRRKASAITGRPRQVQQPHERRDADAAGDVHQLDSDPTSAVQNRAPRSGRSYLC